MWPLESGGYVETMGEILAKIEKVYIRKEKNSK